MSSLSPAFVLHSCLARVRARSYESFRGSQRGNQNVILCLAPSAAWHCPHVSPTCELITNKQSCSSYRIARGSTGRTVSGIRTRELKCQGSSITDHSLLPFNPLTSLSPSTRQKLDCRCWVKQCTGASAVLTWRRKRQSPQGPRKIRKFKKWVKKARKKMKMGPPTVTKRK